MSEILLRAGFFLLMIVLAYLVKRTGVLTKQDGVALSRVVMNITLPCAILVSFRTFVFDWSYMAIPLVSLLSCCLMLALGWWMTRNRSREDRVFHMLALPAYNIGNFILPFVSGVMGPEGVVAACLFDMGNSPMCLGVDYAVTRMSVGETGGRSPLHQLMTIFTKPAFVVYVVMVVLSALSLGLPDVVFEFAGLISAANAPMAMVMIGLMLEFKGGGGKTRDAIVVNVMRLAFAAVVAFLFWRFAPFGEEVRKAVAITAFAPISSASSAFVADLKGDVAQMGLASTISIVAALVIVPVFLVAF